ELIGNGKELVGSAQRRQGLAFPQHGSVMLGAAPERLRRVFPAQADPLAGMTTLEAEIGRRPSFVETESALAEGFREAHRIDLQPDGLHPDEISRSESLAGEKSQAGRWRGAGRAPTAVPSH